MKTLSFNRIKPSELAAPNVRADSLFQLVQADQSVGQAWRLPRDGTRETTGIPKPRKKTRIQNFSCFAPAATSVQLVGCFTNWQEQPIKLRKRANGLWWAAIRLERGTYYYRFLVDDQWRDDSECPLVVPNPFGCLNAVRQVN